MRSIQVACNRDNIGMSHKEARLSSAGGHDRPFGLQGESKDSVHQGQQSIESTKACVVVASAGLGFGGGGGKLEAWKLRCGHDTVTSCLLYLGSYTTRPTILQTGLSHPTILFLIIILQSHNSHHHLAAIAVSALSCGYHGACPRPASKEPNVETATRPWNGSAGAQR